MPPRHKTTQLCNFHDGTFLFVLDAVPAPVVNLLFLLFYPDFRLLLAMASSQIDDRYIFLAADNWNRAVRLVEHSDERYDLIELNRTAAKRAIEKAAFGAAADYLQVAVTGGLFILGRSI